MKPLARLCKTLIRNSKRTKAKMPALIDLRRRIRSVRNTQQITQAMKTVSTAKLKKSQRAVLEGRPYWHNLPALLTRLTCWVEEEHPLLLRREEKKIEGVVITSDKGLCGAFNSNLLTRALSFFEEKARQREVSLVLIGKKAVNFFKRYYFPIDRVHADRVDKLGAQDLKEIAQYLMNLYILSRRDAIYIVYNEFKSIISPRLTITRLLPLSPEKSDEAQDLWLPDWDPESKIIFKFLLPLYIEKEILHCFFESLAAEHASRMMAMDNATKNAEELILDLILILNKIRQASITKELLEIMTAVEALSKS